MSERVEVFKVTLCIVDHDRIGEEEMRLVLENARYPDDCLMPSVVECEKREVDWTDDHPLNMQSTSSSAFRSLFGGGP